MLAGRFFSTSYIFLFISINIILCDRWYDKNDFYGILVVEGTIENCRSSKTHVLVPSPTRLRRVARALNLLSTKAPSPGYLSPTNFPRMISSTPALSPCTTQAAPALVPRTTKAPIPFSHTPTHPPTPCCARALAPCNNKARQKPGLVFICVCTCGWVARSWLTHNDMSCTCLQQL